jgi:hypothetical protein
VPKLGDRFTRTLSIDITAFDKNDSSRVKYFLDESEFGHPILALKDLAANPNKFRRTQGKYCLLLTGSQNEKVLAYLSKNAYRLDPKPPAPNPTHLLAFSYGENPDVNHVLATMVERILTAIPGIVPFAQWEIANVVVQRHPSLRQTVQRIDFDYDKDYITTNQVVAKLAERVQPAETKLLIVAQAWHAPRCIDTCQRHGFTVVGWEVVDMFSPSDPQKWVRNAFAWMLKEGSR